MPVPALVLDLARRAREAELPVVPLVPALARRPREAQLPVVPALLPLAVAASVHLLSRQWFSAAMAGTTP